MLQTATTDKSSPMQENGSLPDASEPPQAEDRFQMLKEAIDSLPITTGITISDIHGKIVYVNAAEAEMHGYGPGELLGKNASVLAPRNLENSSPPLNLAKIGLWRRECLNIRKNGTEFPVQLSSIALRHAAGAGCLGLVTACDDITGRKDSEELIEYLAYYDTVTGLPNRVLLMDRLHQALALAQREGRVVAVLFLDLDNFKDVNDTQGHEVGDKFLKEVAKRLSGCMRECDTLARIGGDEFVLLLTSVLDEDGAASAARQVLSLFSQPIQIEGQQFYSSASIGIALYPDDGQDAESLLKCADAAMYHAKDEGKSNCQFFSCQINNRIMRRVSLENSMRQGIAQQEFSVHYQPQWNMENARLTGVEALLRWHGAEFGCVAPGEFIPIAEKSGLIFELGEMVLRTACLQAREWASAGHGDLKMAVNISGRQFRQPDFLQTVARIIRETGVAPGSLELEFTESVIMEKADKNIAGLRALKEMGVRLSIDDFGTGYSCLSYLKHFPIDTIKIDRSFIADIDRDNDDAAITEAIICMAHSLKLRVIAEGVENGRQMHYLRQHNCDEVQGFYLARPMPAAELTGFLESSRRESAPIRCMHEEMESRLSCQCAFPFP